MKNVTCGRRLDDQVQRREIIGRIGKPIKCKNNNVFVLKKKNNNKTRKTVCVIKEIHLLIIIITFYGAQF